MDSELQAALKEWDDGYNIGPHMIVLADAARRVANPDYEAAHIIAEGIDGLPENAKLWHALADEIVNAALGITEDTE